MILLNYELIGENIGKNTTVTHCFLHGFLGSSQDWRPLIPFLTTLKNGSNAKDSFLFIDLPGHGKSVNLSKDMFSYAFIANQVNEIRKKHKITSITLTGYSMGGRIALAIAGKIAPSKLILESSSLGLKTVLDKETRYKKDSHWSQQFQNSPIHTVLNNWYDQDLFKTINKKHELIKKRAQNNPVGIAHALTYFSVAKMPYLENELKNFEDIAYISGKRDKKYNKLGLYIKKNYPHITHHELENTGHNCHLENPEMYSKIWLDFINKDCQKKEC